MIPTKNIKSRWTMDGNKTVGHLLYTPHVLGNVGQSQPVSYSALCKGFQSLGAIGSCYSSCYDYVMCVIEREKNYVNTVFLEGERN